jgi:hypothetical protein
VGEALNDTLEKVRLRLERGLEKADQELAEMRERCIRLELEIRSIRAYRSDLALLARPDLVGTVDAGSTTAVISIPEATHEPAAPAAKAEPTGKGEPGKARSAAAKGEPTVKAEPVAAKAEPAAKAERAPAKAEPAAKAEPRAAEAEPTTAKAEPTTAVAEPEGASKPTLRRNPAAEPDEDETLSSEIPTSYMPMLEELWDIARHSDAE